MWKCNQLCSVHLKPMYQKKSGKNTLSLGNLWHIILLLKKKKKKSLHINKTSNPAITKQRFPWTNFHAFTSVTLVKKSTPHNESVIENMFISFSVSTVYDLGLSFLPLYSASRETLATLTTLKRTPGMSPTAWPLRPNPATRTSSFSCRAEQRTDGGEREKIQIKITPDVTVKKWSKGDLGRIQIQNQSVSSRQFWTINTHDISVKRCS